MRRALIFAACLTLIACEGVDLEAAPTLGATTLVPRDLPAFFDCLQREGATIVAAHRGGPGRGQAENSIETMARTFQAAPVAMEVDVRRTRDGVLVLMHDEDVARTTTGQGLVAEMSAAEFATLRFRDGESSPPTLQQALDWAEGKTILELDVKRGVSMRDVIDAVDAAGAHHRVVLITYTLRDAIEAHRIDPRLMISAPIEGEADMARLRRAGFNFSRLLAWTGVEEPNAALNVALAEAGVESLFGTLAGWDERFARGESGYAAFAETGIELIASDTPIEAQRALDAADGEGYAPLRCLEAT